MIFNPDNIKVAEFTKDGLVLESGKSITVPNILTDNIVSPTATISDIKSESIISEKIATSEVAVSSDGFLYIGKCWLRQDGDNLVIFDRENGGISLSEIANVCQGNSYGQFEPNIKINNVEEDAFIEATYNKQGKQVYISLNITFKNDILNLEEIIIEDLPYICGFDSELNGVYSYVVKDTNTIKITSIRNTSNGMKIRLSGIYLIKE